VKNIGAFKLYNVFNNWPYFILFYFINFTRGVCVYSVNLIASGRGKGPSITKTLIGIKGRVGWDESTLYAFIWKKWA
jgi:hypothetical protein